MGVHAVVVCSRWGRVVHIGVGCTLGEGCARRGGVHAGGVCTSRGGCTQGEGCAYGRGVHAEAGARWAGVAGIQRVRPGAERLAGLGGADLGGVQQGARLTRRLARALRRRGSAPGRGGTSGGARAGI